MMMSFLILLISVLIGIAFITLFERKILAYSQIRKGPMKTSMMGILQPISDAVKLFTKETINLNFLNSYLMKILPASSLLLMLLYWLTFKFQSFLLMIWSLLFIFFISGISIYPIFGSGWIANSKFSLIGSYRSIAQTISYEVSLAFLFLTMALMYDSFNFNKISLTMNSSLPFFTLNLLFSYMWIISLIAETNRAPFDFAESESELVSGFNTEFGSGLFAFLFLAEYGNIMFFCWLTSFLFSPFPPLLTSFLILVFIWVRTTFPRFRYDNLMNMTWKFILPNTLNLLLLFSLLKFI